MIPRLYAAGTTTFTTEGLGALADCITCETVTSINGIPELYITYPVDGVHASDISERCIIVSDRDTSVKRQPYIVKTVEKASPGTMQIYAVHLCVDLADGVALKPFTATSLGNAINSLGTYATSALPITVATTKSSSTDFHHAIPSTLKNAMGGMEGSFLDTYGGEWEFSGLTATLKSSIGSNNGVIIQYGKNLESLDVLTDWSGVYTGIYPFWTDSNSGAVKQMTSPVYSLGTFSFERVLMLDVSSNFQTQPSDAELLAAAQAYEGSHNLTSPAISWNVIMRALRNTPEYKTVALLEAVALGDTVTIYLEKFGVSATARITAERYDVLREEYNELTVGSVRANLGSTIATQIKDTLDQITDMENTMEGAIKRATDAITGNTGGYIVTVMNGSGQPQELLIMNDPDITQATDVWRWNVNGLGYSSTGYAGPYTTAITQSGEIVADFITTGTLNAALVNVINLIAEHVQAVDGSKTMDIDAAQLKVNNGANWRVWLRTDIADQGAMIVYGGKRTNLNGQAVDPGNDSSSSMSYIDPHGIAVGLDNTDKATGSIRAGSMELQNGDLEIHGGMSIVLFDPSSNIRIWADGSNGRLRAYDASGNVLWALRDTGNIQSYYNGQERVGIYPQEGQISLYNSSGTRTVQIRGDGTASSAPLPVNQGGTGYTGTDSITATVSATVGSITVTDCRRWGRVAMVTLDCVNTSAIAAMNYLARGTLSGSNVPLPKRLVTAVQFTGAHLSVCSLDTDGTITSRVMVGTLPANSSRRFVFTYLIW